MKTSSLALALLVALAPATLPVSAFAQATDETTTKEARARFQEGVDLFDRGQFEQARAKFVQAYALRKHPAVLLNLAQSSLRAGHPLEAVKTFQQFLRDSATVTPQQRETVDKGMAEARTKLGRLEISAPTAAELSVDGTVVGVAPLSEPVDVEAGMHTVKAKMTDGTTDSKSVGANAGEKVQVRLGATVPPVAPVPTPPGPTTATPPTAPPPAEQPPPAIAELPPPAPPAAEPEKEPRGHGLFDAPKTMVPVYAGGAVTVIGAGAAVLFYVFKQNALDSGRSVAHDIEQHGGNSSTCPSHTDPAKFGSACQVLNDDVDKANTDATLGNISVGVAVLGAVTAVGWYLFAPKRDASDTAPPSATWRAPTVAPMVGHGVRGLSLHAEF